MYRLIFPSLYHRGRWLSGAAPILSDPRPESVGKKFAAPRNQVTPPELTADAMGSSGDVRTLPFSG